MFKQGFRLIKQGCGRWLLPAVMALFTSGVSAQDNTPGFEVETAYIEASLELNPGLTVADVGAGDGRYSVFLSERVGANGKILSTEIDQEKVDTIRKVVADKNNVSVILGKVDSTELPAECCDRIFLRRVYHHLDQPQPMLASLFNALKPGGLILIIDFLPRHDLPNQDATPGDHGHGTTIDRMTAQVTMAGFELVRQIEDWPSRIVDDSAVDYAVLFRSPALVDDHSHMH